MSLRWPAGGSEKNKIEDNIRKQNRKYCLLFVVFVICFSRSLQPLVQCSSWSSVTLRKPVWTFCGNNRLVNGTASLWSSDRWTTPPSWLRGSSPGRPESAPSTSSLQDACIPSPWRPTAATRAALPLWPHGPVRLIYFHSICFFKDGKQDHHIYIYHYMSGLGEMTHTLCETI